MATSIRIEELAFHHHRVVASRDQGMHVNPVRRAASSPWPWRRRNSALADVEAVAIISSATRPKFR